MSAATDISLLVDSVGPGIAVQQVAGVTLAGRAVELCTCSPGF
jgi:hypothetical protein